MKGMSLEITTSQTCHFFFDTESIKLYTKNYLFYAQQEINNLLFLHTVGIYLFFLKYKKIYINNIGLLLCKARDYIMIYKGQ